MHDVLGHRLSLLSVHAGALEFRPDAPAEEVARAAKVIRENAHQALQDLREKLDHAGEQLERASAEAKRQGDELLITQKALDRAGAQAAELLFVMCVL